MRASIAGPSWKVVCALCPLCAGVFSRLENVVALGNMRAQRLLTLWGFTVGGEVTMRNGVEFIPFFWER